MRAFTTLSIDAMEDSERQILERLDARIARLDEWITTAAHPALIDTREELEMTRVSYEHQLALTRRVVERALRSFDRFDARINQALNENSQAIRALRESLSGENGSA